MYNKYTYIISVKFCNINLIQVFLLFFFVADVENTEGCDAKFGLIFGCVRKGVKAVIQNLESDTDGTKAGSFVLHGGVDK